MKLAKAAKVVVEFRDVGRDRKSWTSTIAPTEKTMIAAIRKSRAILSRGISVEVLNEDYTGILEIGMSGEIWVGGCRRVGTFEVMEPTS